MVVLPEGSSSCHCHVASRVVLVVPSIRGVLLFTLTNVCFVAMFGFFFAVCGAAEIRFRGQKLQKCTKK